MKNVLKYISVLLIWVLSQPRRFFKGQRTIDLQNAHCLIVSMSGIGNAIMSTPLFRALKENGAATVDVLTVGPAHKVIFDHIEYCDTAIIYPRTWKKRLRLYRSLRQKKYDALFLAFTTPEISHALLPIILKPRISLTHDYSSFHPYFKYLKQVASYVLPIQSDAHDIEQNLNLISALGYNYTAFEKYPELQLPESALEKAQTFLIERKLNGSTLCFMHPGCTRGKDYKRWPVERFVEIGKMLQKQHGVKIVVIIGPDEKEFVDDFDHPDFYCTESLSFDVTLALLSRASVIVSNDSGLMHAAALLRVPTVTIWGGTDINRNGARGNVAMNIVNEEITCRPCVRFFPQVNCPDIEFDCIRSIPVQRVYEAIDKSGLLSE